MRLDGKVAVVTGGTRGIGRGTVERYGEEGAQVFFSGRNAEEGGEIQRSLRDRGLDVTYVRADSSVEDDVRGLIGKAVDSGGRLDVLVNNAAAADYDRIGGVNGAIDQPIHAVTDDVIHGILGVGLYGALWACRYATREMMKAGSGSIINLSSPVAVLGYPGTPIYSVSKGALDALTRNMAADYGRYGIRTNSVIPGYVPTTWQHYPQGPGREGAPHGKMLSPWLGKPLDLANAMLFLASDESEFITGAVIAVDGGLSTFAPSAVMREWDVMRPPEQA